MGEALPSPSALDALAPDDRRRVLRALEAAVEAQRAANEAKRELLRVLETVLPAGS